MNLRVDALAVARVEVAPSDLLFSPVAVNKAHDTLLASATEKTFATLKRRSDGSITMKILLVTPHSLKSPRGNTRTTNRWGSMLERTGHQVTIAESYESGDGEYDLMIALHAHKTSASVRRFRKKASVPIILALTGTDLYPDVYRKRSAAGTLDTADRLIVLQPLALARLKPEHREKTRVVHQCVAPNYPDPDRAPDSRFFTVCVIGHLRPVKDPFRAAMAARRLPPTSRVRILHFGEALSESMAARARAEEERNKRYRWHGLVSPREILVLLRDCHLLVVSSKHEGGANVISEAVASDLPILASEIDGNIGLLGPEYPGYFPVGDTQILARLMDRAEREPAFRSRLQEHCRELRSLLANPENEREALAGVVAEVCVG